MSNTSPRTVHLKSLLSLEEKRAALQQQIDEIHQQISSTRDQIFNQTSSAVTQAVRKVVAKGRTQRGALKAQILSALEAAGHAGVRVTELAESLGTKAANLHAWFHATAKRMPSIVKVKGGHYRLNGNGHKPAAPVAAPAKAAKVKANGRKAGKAKRGALSENILAALSGAGSNGVSIKDLSDKVGSNYRNVAVWFATTGKKNPKIKKVAPATYKLAA
ncbi:MAG: hypothetical protein P4L99_19030 [Chthoniobacter sp.]|nr:hypothetical protein [Chthoniobacter sp.]